MSSPPNYPDDPEELKAYLLAREAKRDARFQKLVAQEEAALNKLDETQKEFWKQAAELDQKFKKLGFEGKAKENENGAKGEKSTTIVDPWFEAFQKRDAKYRLDNPGYPYGEEQLKKMSFTSPGWDGEDIDRMRGNYKMYTMMWEFEKNTCREGLLASLSRVPADTKKNITTALAMGIGKMDHEISMFHLVVFLDIVRHIGGDIKILFQDRKEELNATATTFLKGLGIEVQKVDEPEMKDRLTGLDKSQGETAFIFDPRRNDNAEAIFFSMVMNAGWPLILCPSASSSGGQGIFLSLYEGKELGYCFESEAAKLHELGLYWKK